VTRQAAERRRHIPHGVVFDEAEPVIVESAKLHG